MREPWGQLKWQRWAKEFLKEQAGLRRYVLRELEQRGPLLSRELEHHAARAEERTVWWGTRAHLMWMLELLHSRGRIAVAGRQSGQRLWDLAERWYPGNGDGAAGRSAAAPRREALPRARRPARERTPRRSPRGRGRAGRDARHVPLAVRPPRSTTATGPRRSGTSSTGSRCTCRRRSASTATTSSRSCVETGSSAASSRPSTARPECSACSASSQSRTRREPQAQGSPPPTRRLAKWLGAKRDLVLAPNAVDLARQSSREALPRRRAPHSRRGAAASGGAARHVDPRRGPAHRLSPARPDARRRAQSSARPLEPARELLRRGAAAALEERELYEYSAAIVPTEDYPLHRSAMRRYPAYEAGKTWNDGIKRWLKDNAAAQRQILAQLRRDGPLALARARGLEMRPWESTGWTNERNLTRMLEFLSLQGKVLVSKREGGQRLWDVAEHVVPERRRKAKPRRRFGRSCAGRPTARCAGSASQRLRRFDSSPSSVARTPVSARPPSRSAARWTSKAWGRRLIHPAAEPRRSATDDAPLPIRSADPKPRADAGSLRLPLPARDLRPEGQARVRLLRAPDPPRRSAHRADRPDDGSQGQACSGERGLRRGSGAGERGACDREGDLATGRTGSAPMRSRTPARFRPSGATACVTKIQAWTSRRARSTTARSPIQRPARSSFRSTRPRPMRRTASGSTRATSTRAPRTRRGRRCRSASPRSRAPSTAWPSPRGWRRSRRSCTSSTRASASSPSTTSTAARTGSSRRSMRPRATTSTSSRHRR